MSAVLEPEDALSGVPVGLRAPLLAEYNKLVRNFREGRWEPSELNGGKLSEVIYSILKGHVDGRFPASPSKPSNMVDACRSLEKATEFPRSVRIQMPRVLVALYEIRNNRNVGHVGADVDPNHMDAALVLAMAKWLLSELIRIFHNLRPEEAAAIVDRLVDRTVPLVWAVRGQKRVLSNELTATDKALVLLYSSSSDLPVKDLIRDTEYSNGSRFRAKVLSKAHRDNLVHFDKKADIVTLSPKGVNYVETKIALEVD